MGSKFQKCIFSYPDQNEPLFGQFWIFCIFDLQGGTCRELYASGGPKNQKSTFDDTEYHEPLFKHLLIIKCGDPQREGELSELRKKRAKRAEREASEAS